MQLRCFAFFLLLAAAGSVHAVPVFDDAACAAGAPGLILHDDDLADDGYHFGQEVVSARVVDKFTPLAYPATFSRVCISLFSGEGVESLDFDVVVYQDDGDNGGPGTLLASMPAGGGVLQLFDFPFTPRFVSLDIADLGINLTSGSAYIGLRWNPSQNGGDLVYVSADLSPQTPQGSAYLSYDEGEWKPAREVLPNYRALILRAVGAPGGARAPWLRTSFAPARIMANETSTLSIKLSNVSQPSAAVLQQAFVDVLPAGLVVAAVPNANSTCGGALEATPGAGSFALASGGSIPAAGTCTIAVDVTAAADGDYLNTLAAGALNTQHGSNADAAQANLHVGYVFPEPYCNATFPGDTWPIARVQFAGIDNASDAAIGGSPPLENFTAIVGHVAAGQTLPMTVKGRTENPAVVTAFVDWNHDGDFDDADESYRIGELAESSGVDGVQVSAGITVPPTALAGATRLRVSLMAGGAAMACNWLGFGQAEDYTVQVAGGDPIFADGFEG